MRKGASRIFLNTAFACLNGEKATVLAALFFFSISRTQAVQFKILIFSVVPAQAFVYSYLYKVQMYVYRIGLYKRILIACQDILTSET